MARHTFAAHSAVTKTLGGQAPKPTLATRLPRPRCARSMRYSLRFLGGAFALATAISLLTWWRVEGVRRSSAAGAAPAPSDLPAPHPPRADTPEPPPRSPRFARSLNLSIESFPSGSALRRDLERLDPAPRARAFAQLARATFGIEDTASLHADSHGGVYFVCAAPAQAEAAQATAPLATTAESEATPAAAAPITAPPIRHSRPGCANVIYLDFDGAIVEGTGWNSGAGRAASYDCLPFDTDGDPTHFSDAEQIAMVQIWERVAEDYAPFEVDVTTEAPAAFTATTAHALITRPRDRNDIALPSPSAGGVAYVDVFGEPDYSHYRPAFVYYSNLSSRADYVAEAVSHEVGHNLGLSHDGLADGRATYYAGHGSGETSWAPIMGSAYNRHVTQWSKGGYTNANNPEDDLAILDSKLARRADDAGNTPATALALGDGTAQVSIGSVLETTTDADAFSFLAANGSLGITLTPYRAAAQTNGGNADLTLELLDADGNVLATAAPAGLTSASLNTTLTAAGRYCVRVTTGGTGDPLASSPTGYAAYGALGQLTIAITRVPAAPPNLLNSPTAAACLPGGAAVFTAAFAGIPAPTLQWEFRPADTGTWTPIDDDAHHQGAATATLALAAVPPDFHDRHYRCVARNGIGDPVPSAEAALSVGYTWPTFLGAHFTPAELATPALCGAAADPDGDGLANLLEYALARHPRTSEGEPALQFTLAGDAAILTYRRVRAAADLSFVLEQSGDLASWSKVASTDLQATSSPVSAMIDEVVLQVATSGATHRFYRLRVSYE